MKRFLQLNLDGGLLALRLAFGLMMMVHGLQKLNKFSEYSGFFPDPFGLGSTASLSLAIFAELGCSVLLLLGLLTPLALVALIITMLVAIFYAHGSDPWEKKELAVSYLSAYVTLLLTGPGRYSLDHLFFSKRQ